MDKAVKKDLFVFLISLTALICAVVTLNDSLNQLTKKEQG